MVGHETIGVADPIIALIDVLQDVDPAVQMHLLALLAQDSTGRVY